MANLPYQALKKIKTEICIYEDSKDTVEMYNVWAEKYEDDTDAIGYIIPDASAEVVIRNVGGDSEKVVLDILCGTGLVGFHLKRRGFSGTLHGLDGSDGMLKLAAEKQVYQTLTKKLLEPSKGEGMDGKFTELDAITCVGGFLKAHLDAKILPDLAESLKRGGCLVYTARGGTTNEECMQPVEEEAKKLVESGFLREKEIVKTSHGVNWDVEEYEDIKLDHENHSFVHIYCYEKC